MLFDSRSLLAEVGRFVVLCLEVAAWVFLVALVLWLLAGTRPSEAATIPAAAAKHRADLTRNARVVWGLDAPAATFAAQVHQESAWRPGAASRVGAAGLAQFMPATASWISQRYPELASADSYNPGGALRALLRYDAWLFERTDAAGLCERWAMTLSAYNGGLGWVLRDQRLAASQGLDPRTWFDAVETVNAGRSAANWRENRAYPRRILHLLEPVYVAAGWGRGVCA